MKQKLAVIGYPLEKTLSPMLHNRWLERYNIDCFYEKKPLLKEELGNFIKESRDSHKGFNVTSPYKELIIDYVDDISLDVEKSGSANCILVNNGKLFAYNTDIYGIDYMLKNVFENSKILIIGSGGLVNSLLFCLNRKKNVPDILARSLEKVNFLKEMFSLGSCYDMKNISSFDSLLPNYDLVINATNIDFFNQMSFSNNSTKLIDMNYFFDYKLPNIQNGIRMFTSQAARSFFIWFNINPIGVQDE